jgi:hypothetical protein
MARYLSIISKQSFFSLYKFGYIPLFWQDLIPYSFKYDQGMHSALLEQFSNYAQIEFDEDYLIILWNKEIEEKEKIIFELRDAERIVPLTRQAKASLTRKTGGKIHFSEPFFENIYTELEVQNIESNGFRGSKAFWELAGLPSSYYQVYDKNLLKKALELRLAGKHSFELQAQEFVTHLFLYEGYEKFPRYCALGFIYDVIKVLTDWKGITLKAGEKAYSKSGSFQYLEANRKQLEELNFLGLLKGIENSEEEALIKFRENLTVDGLKYWVVAFLFLNFKEEIREANSISETKLLAKIKHVIKDKTYLPELEYAISLLGYFFGFTKFYDDYYKHLDLYILTGKKEQANKSSVIQKLKNKTIAPKKPANSKEKIPLISKDITTGEPKASKPVKHEIVKEENVPVDNVGIKPISAESVDASYVESAKINSESEVNPVNGREVLFTIPSSQNDSKKELLGSEGIDSSYVLKSDEQGVLKSDVNENVIVSGEVEEQVNSIQNEGVSNSQEGCETLLFPQPDVDNSLEPNIENVSDNEQNYSTTEVESVNNEAQIQHPELKSLDLQEEPEKVDNSLNTVQENINNPEEQKDVLTKESEIGEIKDFSETEDITLLNADQQQLALGLLDSKDK